MRTSRNAGSTWTCAGVTIDPAMGIGKAGHVGQFLRLRDGTFIVPYLDYTELNPHGWNVEKGEPYQLRAFVVIVVTAAAVGVPGVLRSHGARSGMNGAGRYGRYGKRKSSDMRSRTRRTSGGGELDHG